MVMAFSHFEPIWMNLTTMSGHGHVKNVKFWHDNFDLTWHDMICKNTLFLRRMSPGSNGVTCVSVRGLYKFPKQNVLLYDVTIRRNVVEINLAFGGQKIMYRFEILFSGGCKIII